MIAGSDLKNGAIPSVFRIRLVYWKELRLSLICMRRLSASFRITGKIQSVGVMIVSCAAEAKVPVKKSARKWNLYPHN